MPGALRRCVKRLSASSFRGDRALELGDRIGQARRALRPAGRRVTEPGRDPAGDAAAVEAAVKSSSPVRQACTLVLPSNGAFDSRAWRIASTLAARGHDVTVMARSEAGLPDREDHPAACHFPVKDGESVAAAGKPS